MLQNHDMFEKICLEAVAQPEACNFTKKETLAQVFSCEFCEISKNTFYYRTSLVAASVCCLDRLVDRSNILKRFFVIFS